MAKCRTKRGKCAPVVQRATGGLLRRGGFPPLLQRQQARAMVPPPALCQAAFAQVAGFGAAVEAGPPAYEGKHKLSFSSAAKQTPHAQDSILEGHELHLRSTGHVANQACGPDGAMQPWPQARDVGGHRDVFVGNDSMALSVAFIRREEAQTCEWRRRGTCQLASAAGSRGGSSGGRARRMTKEHCRRPPVPPHLQK